MFQMRSERKVKRERDAERDSGWWREMQAELTG